MFMEHIDDSTLMLILDGIRFICLEEFSRPIAYPLMIGCLSGLLCGHLDKRIDVMNFDEE